MNRFFLDRDSSAHWYLVAADHRQDWIAWCDDEEAWDVPDWAHRLKGGPEAVEFELGALDLMEYEA